MGLFGFRSKKAANLSPSAAPTTPEQFPGLFAGMKVEVLTPANALLFVGRLTPLEDERLEIRSEAGSFLPRALYNQPVKLRCFQKDGTALTLNGTVAQNSPEFWRIENLKGLQNSEHRSFFRQNTGVEGSVVSSDPERDGKHACKVLDVSAGGARIVTEALFPLGDTFQLTTALLPDEEPYCISCQVMRIQEWTTPGSPLRKFEYGCQFVDLPEREQDRLLQSIFTLQRKMLQSRRD